MPAGSSRGPERSRLPATALCAIVWLLTVLGLLAQDLFTAGVYKPGDVTTLPKVKTKVAPPFVGGVVKGPEGQLRVEIVIDAKGSVKAARIAQPLAGSPDYDADTLKAAKEWKFVAGEKDGKAVPVLATVVVAIAMQPLSRGTTTDVALGARIFVEGADDAFANGTSALDEPGVTMPRRVKAVPPNYPVSAMTSGQGGEVLLEAVILPDGTVGRVRVIRPVDIQIDKAAVAAAMQWTYEPPTKNGQPVSLLIPIVMRFNMR